MYDKETLHLKYYKLMENPNGMLQLRGFMQTLPFLVGLCKYVFDMCAFGQPFRKHSNAWTDLPWEPKGSTGSGLCENGKCEQGAFDKFTKRFRHFFSLGQDPARFPKGTGTTQLVNSIPTNLSQEWIDCLKQQAHPGDTIVDWCSGYQHLKPVALANGFNYIAVDIRGDRSNKGAYDFAATSLPQRPRPRRKLQPDSVS